MNAKQVSAIKKAVLDEHLNINTKNFDDMYQYVSNIKTIKSSMDIGVYCHIKNLLSNLAPGKKIKSEKLELLAPLLDKGIPSSVLKDVFISLISSGQEEMFSFLLEKDQLKKMDSKDVDAVVNFIVACESVLGKIDIDDDALSMLIGDNESFFLDRLLFYNIFDKYNITEKQKMFESVLSLQQIEKAELFFKYQLGVDINALNNQGKTAFDIIIEKYTTHHTIATLFNKNKTVDQDSYFINNKAIPFLKKYNYNFNMENLEAHTAIMQSVRYDMGTTIKNIIDAGGKLEEKSSIGISAMELYEMKDKKSFSKETVSAVESFVLGKRYDVEKKNKTKAKRL